MRDTEALPPRQGRERAAVSGCMVSCDHLISCHSPGEADTLASVRASAQRWIWAGVGRERLDRALCLAEPQMPTQAAPWAALRTGTSLASALPSGDKIPGVGRGEDTHLMGMEPAHASRTGLLLRRGSDPSLNRAGMATDQRGRFASRPGPTLSSDSSLTKVIADSAL